MGEDPNPAFVYTVGDIVSFHGDATEYTPQFYAAYGHLAMPIVGIPGNHDGDTTDDPSRQPLDTFMANFCSPEAKLPPPPVLDRRDARESAGGRPRP